jgi:NAD(P)-dependent dehydrogenase (short-subunit alcohol dehydrogenase family)
MSGLINYNGFSLDQTPDLSGRVMVLTGGNKGIGRDIALQLLLHGVSRLYILARSSEDFNDAEDYWAQQLGDAENEAAKSLGKRVEFLQCDLTDVTVVKRVGDELLDKLNKEKRLDALICNAGTIPQSSHATIRPIDIL